MQRTSVCKNYCCTEIPSDYIIMQCILLPVTLLTVLETGSQIQLYPAQHLTQTDDIDVVTIDNTTVELALLDNDPSTCLQAFDNGSLFLSLVAYIYVPSCMPNVHVMLRISGLPCSDQSVTLYQDLSTAGQYGIRFQECIRVMAGNKNKCEFVCDNARPEYAIMKLGIRIVKCHGGLRNQ